MLDLKRKGSGRNYLKLSSERKGVCKPCCIDRLLVLLWEGICRTQERNTQRVYYYRKQPQALSPHTPKYNCILKTFISMETIFMPCVKSSVSQAASANMTCFRPTGLSLLSSWILGENDCSLGPDFGPHVSVCALLQCNAKSLAAWRIISRLSEKLSFSIL